MRVGAIIVEPLGRGRRAARRPINRGAYHDHSIRAAGRVRGIARTDADYAHASLPNVDERPVTYTDEQAGLVLRLFLTVWGNYMAATYQ